MLITKSLTEKILQDFDTIRLSLGMKKNDSVTFETFKKIHAKLFLLKSFIIRCESNLKPTSAKYLNESVSDLIESYVMLHQNRYKTSKILLRSSIDCFMRGLFIEYVSVEMKQGFTDNFNKLNGHITEVFSEKGISTGFLAKTHTSLQASFEEFSRYVHGGASIELSQYESINEILSPQENIDLKREHILQMNEYLSKLLFYLILSNLILFYEKCPLNLQNAIIDELDIQDNKVMRGKLKSTYFN